MADISTCPPLTRESVVAAHEIVRRHVHRTPVMTCGTLDRMASSPSPSPSPSGAAAEAEAEAEPKAEPKPVPNIRLWFKCENLQRIGAFKVRGAFHAVERLRREPGLVEGGGWAKGVVTHSSGNHAQALALAAREAGIPAHIVMPDISPAPKIAATRGYGAHVVFSGPTSAEREAAAARVVAETGARLVPPYDHPDIILGQGTLGLELQEQVAEAMEAAAASTTTTTNNNNNNNNKKKKKKKKRGLDAIIAPCGGGGMLSGVALSCEGTGVRVFGAEPSFEGADDARRGVAAGRRVEAVRTRTVADGLRTPLGAHPWSVLYERRLASGFYAVGEEQILRAMRLLYERAKLVVEPSAAVPLAVALYDDEFREMVAREAGPEGWDVGIVLSGGNVELDKLGGLFARVAGEGGGA